MSGILDRMAKRALGALPTLQPLTAPSYAAAAGGVRPSLNLEMNFEREAPTPQAETRPRRQIQPETAKNGGELRGPFEGRDRAEEFSATKRSAGMGMRSEDRAQTGRSGLEVSALGDQTEATPDPGRMPGKEDAARARDRGTGGAKAAGGLRLRPEEDSMAEPLDSAAEGPALKLQSSKRETPVAPVVERSQPSRRPSAAQRESAALAEQKTEVHISIGSIELRAPRVEARPSAAPFRPRVSLQDFLRRKPEAGA